MTQFKEHPVFKGYYANKLGVIAKRKSDGKLYIQNQVKHSKSGYYVVRVTTGKQLEYVHRFVLAVFVSIGVKGEECHHLNNDRGDNKLENLVWVTPKENSFHMLEHGTVLTGEMHKRSKLTDTKVLQIRTMLKNGGSPTHIAKLFGVSQAAIYCIEVRKTWKHL